MLRRTTKIPTALAAAALLVVATALAAACSAPSGPPDGGSPTSPSTPRASLQASPTPAATTPGMPSPSPTPTSTWPLQIALPTPPPEMSRDDETGAVAAATYFLDLYTYTESTQDTGPWKAMSHADCSFCNSVLDEVETRRAAGQVVYPAKMNAHSAEPTMLNPLMYSIAIDLSTGPDQVLRADGTVVDPGKLEHGVMTTIVTYRYSSWVVREVNLDPDE